MTGKAPRTGSTPNKTPEHQPDWQDAKWRSGLRRRLLAWFDANARRMPWRDDPKPYHVWVSEIMLQQTQVATVLPYYERWMRSFPTIADLAAADESTLMRHWEGLGYYRRVRSMHAAAQQIMQQHGGLFPKDFESVLALPGVGRYTAGAVLSISSDARYPVLEGNTQRVYSRWIALRDHPTDKDANRLLWEVAETMLPRTGSGRFNQAAMELGALVCTPKSPACDACPAKSFCAAHRLGLESEIPGRMKTMRYEARTEFALVVERPTSGPTASPPHPSGPSAPSQQATEYLVRPLPEGGRWAGLWDFPRPTESELKTVDDAASWLGHQLGCDVVSGIRFKTLRHAVTKYRISLHVHQATLQRQASGRGRNEVELPTPWRWATLEELHSRAMSVTGRKIVEFLGSKNQSLLPLR